MMANPMSPGQPAGANPSLAQGSQPSIGDLLEQAHGNIQTLFAQVSKHMAMLDKIGAGLQSLSKLGDTITSDDVIGEAGELIGAGMGPHDMARLLADMPQGGEALAGWVAQHAQVLQQNKQGLQQQHDILRHEVGMSSINMLLHHPGGKGPEVPSAPSPSAGASPAQAPGGASPGSNLLTNLSPAGSA